MSGIFSVYIQNGCNALSLLPYHLDTFMPSIHLKKLLYWKNSHRWARATQNGENFTRKRMLDELSLCVCMLHKCTRLYKCACVCVYAMSAYQLQVYVHIKYESYTQAHHLPPCMLWTKDDSKRWWWWWRKPNEIWEWCTSSWVDDMQPSHLRSTHSMVNFSAPSPATPTFILIKCAACIVLALVWYVCDFVIYHCAMCVV